MRDLIGEEIGPYKVVEKLGRGGMADVYKAFHVDLEVNRAIKVIRPEFVGADDFKARFQREAKAVAALQHPNIVQIHDFGSHEGNYFMVMEFVDGQDLKKIIQTKGAIRPINDALIIVQQVARALSFAHGKDLLHRDIKPENIMLRADGSPVLMDFGIAKLLTANTQLTQTGVGIGTPSYMSPEQAQATDKLGPASDLYSLTVVLYEMLTGQVPYSADTPIAVMLKVISDPLPLPRQLSPDISESVQQFLIKGTSKDPERRHLNGEEYANDLQALLLAPSSSSLEETVVVDQRMASDSPDELALSPSSSKIRRIVGSLVAIAVVAAISLFLWPGSPSHDRESVEHDSDKETRLAPETSIASVEPIESTRQSADTEGKSSVVVEYRGNSKKESPIVMNVRLNEKDTVYMQVHSSSATTDFELRKIDARKSTLKSYTSSGPHNIAESGNYELSITPRKSEAEVDVQLWRLKPAQIHAGDLEKNTPVAGRTTAPGQSVLYRAALETDDVVYLDVIESSSTTDFSIVHVDGRQQLHKPSYTDIGPVKVDTPGIYNLVVDPRKDAVIDYLFNLHVFRPAVIDKGLLEFGKWYESAIEHPGQVIKYNFEQLKGRAVYLDIASVSSTIDFSIISQDGQQELFKNHVEPGKILTVPDDRNYVLVVDPRGDKTASFRFKVHLVDQPVIAAGQFAVGDVVKGKTTQPGQLVQYTFELAEAATIEFEVLRSEVFTDFILQSTDGDTETFKTLHGGTVPLKSGRYTVVVDPRKAKLADYEFRLVNNVQQ